MVRMWEQLKRWCVSCECYRGDIVVMDVILCKYNLRKGDLFLLRWARVRRVRRGSLFRTANVWWRCAQCFVIASCG